MYLRSYQLGDEVPIFVQVVDAAKRPIDPDAAPRAAVYDNAGNVVKDFYLPVVDKAETVGCFMGTVFLGPEFAAGHYRVVIRWLLSSILYGGDVVCFEIQAGGSETGQVIAMHSYERPHSNFTVQQRTSGRIYKGRNARV